MERLWTSLRWEIWNLLHKNNTRGPFLMLINNNKSWLSSIKNKNYEKQKFEFEISFGMDHWFWEKGKNQGIDDKNATWVKKWPGVKQIFFATTVVANCYEYFRRK